MQTFKQIKKYGSRALVAVSAAAFGTAAMAQTATNPINQMLEAIGLDPATTCNACWSGKYPTLIANSVSA